MNNPQKVRLYLRLTVNGSRQFFEPVYAANGKLKPFVALVNGEAKRLDDATYYLRYSSNGKRCWQAVGEDAQLAFQKRLHKENLLTAKAAGLEVVEPGPREIKKRPATSALDTTGAVETYLKDISQYRRGRTYTAYKNTLEAFRDFSKKPSLDLVDRRDVLNFVDHLKRNGNGKRTAPTRSITCSPSCADMDSRRSSPGRTVRNTREAGEVLPPRPAQNPIRSCRQ